MYIYIYIHVLLKHLHACVVYSILTCRVNADGFVYIYIYTIEMKAPYKISSQSFCWDRGGRRFSGTGNLIAQTETLFIKIWNKHGHGSGFFDVKMDMFFLQSCQETPADSPACFGEGISVFTGFRVFGSP